MSETGEPGPSPSNSAASGGSGWATLGAIAVLVLLSSLPKLGLILAPRADLFLKGTQGETATFQPEELDNGSIALDLLEGPILPLLDYQHAPHCGGSLVVGVLAVPFFALFGPTLPALKMTVLVWNAALCAFTFLVLLRFVGRRAAWFGGLLAALPPPGYATMSVLAWGTHVEQNGLALAILWTFLVAYEGARPRLGFVFACGVLAGLALYFGLIIALLLALLLFVRFLTDKAFLVRKDALAALAGFVLGFAPWIVFNVRHDFPAKLAFQHAAGEDLDPLTLGDRLERARETVTTVFPRSLFFPDVGALDGRVLDVAGASLLALLALVALARGGLGRNLIAPFRALVRKRDGLVPLGVLCWGYLAVFLIAYSSQVGFTIGSEAGRLTTYRYIVVVYPFLWIAAGIGLDQVARQGRGGRTLAVALVTVLAAGGTLANAPNYDLGRFGDECEKPGYSRRSLGRFLVGTYAREPELVLSAVKKAEELRTPDELEELYTGMSRYLRTVQLAPPERLDPRLRRDLPHYEALRERLFAEVDPRYRSMFAPAVPRGRPAPLPPGDG